MLPICRYKGPIFTSSSASVAIGVNMLLCIKRVCLCVCACILFNVLYTLSRENCNTFIQCYSTVHLSNLEGYCCVHNEMDQKIVGGSQYHFVPSVMQERSVNWDRDTR